MHFSLCSSERETFFRMRALLCFHFSFHFDMDVSLYAHGWEGRNCSLMVCGTSLSRNWIILGLLSRLCLLLWSRLVSVYSFREHHHAWYRRGSDRPSPLLVDNGCYIHDSQSCYILFRRGSVLPIPLLVCNAHCRVTWGQSVHGVGEVSVRT